MDRGDGCLAAGLPSEFIPLRPFILPLNLQSPNVYVVQRPDVQRPQVQVLPIRRQHNLLSLRRETIKHAHGRTVDVVVHPDAAGLAVDCAVELASVQVLECVGVGAVDPNLGLGGVDADVGVLYGWWC